MLPPPPTPLCTLVVIWLSIRCKSEPVEVMVMLPPSACTESVEIDA